jgi:outer membrane PBP1 activator LpoA protein
MGGGGSRPAQQCNSSCCPERDSWQRSFYSVQAEAVQLKNQLAQLQQSKQKVDLDFGKLQVSYDILAARALDTDNTKDKAIAMMEQLAGRVTDQMALYQTQQDLLKRQASIAQQKTEEIEDKKNVASSLSTDIYTRKRTLYYDEQIDNLKRFAIFLLRIFVFIVGVIVIVVIGRALWYAIMNRWRSGYGGDSIVFG